MSYNNYFFEKSANVRTITSMQLRNQLLGVETRPLQKRITEPWGSNAHKVSTRLSMVGQMGQPKVYRVPSVAGFPPCSVHHQHRGENAVVSPLYTEGFAND